MLVHGYVLYKTIPVTIITDGYEFFLYTHGYIFYPYPYPNRVFTRRACEKWVPIAIPTLDSTRNRNVIWSNWWTLGSRGSFVALYHQRRTGRVVPLSGVNWEIALLVFLILWTDSSVKWSTVKWNSVSTKISGSIAKLVKVINTMKPVE